MSPVPSERFWQLSGDLLCAIGFDGCLRHVNPAWERLLGWTEEELRGRPLIEFVHPDDRERTAGAVKLAAQERETSRFDTRYEQKGGGYRDLEWSARAIPEDELIYAHVRDCTESNVAVDQLRSSEHFLDSVLEHLPNMVFVKDAEELRFVRFNAAGEELLGISRAELLGKNDRDLFPAEQAEFFIAKDREVLDRGELVDIAEEPIESRVHGVRYLHTRKIPLLDGAGRARYLLGISEDITERKQAEAEVAARLDAEQRALAEAEAARKRIAGVLALTDVALSHRGLEDLLDELLGRLREVLAADTAVILLLDPDADVLVARAAKGLEEEVERGVTIPVGQGFAGRVAAECRPVVIDDLDKVHVANPLLREKGVRSLLGVPLLLDGTTIGVLHVGSLTRREFGPEDISLLQLVADRAALAIERTRLFEAQRVAYAAAESARVDADHANLAKSQFLSRMSHELRTPLNAILGFGQLLEREPMQPRQRDDLGHILKAGRHLLELINEVLEISRIEAGELALSPEPVAIAETVQEALSLVNPLAAERHVQLAMDATGLAADGHVRADRQRLRQVLLNLLSNAIKYNRAGGRVEVSFQTVDHARIQTLIADTGIGIEPRQLVGLFEPFERLGAEHSDIEGTGLGLALAKRLVEAMDGSIAVDSRPGEGTTFTIELQATDSPENGANADLGPLAAPEIVGSADRHRHRILYIEDNLANLRLVERILERQIAVELIPAMQGRLGLELANQHHPDLIMLDLHLPDMSGEEVLRRLRADHATRGIPVVVLSAEARKTEADRLRGLGADDYLTKPLDIGLFLDAISSHLMP